ncbi:MAG TPA: hypothetical protein VKA80_02040 [Beijerinckiaceae bacterium]|jgi:hypothetical protein|nr:hypothetical protein [Beijerinckiaceae bacterium]
MAKKDKAKSGAKSAKSAKAKRNDGLKLPKKLRISGQTLAAMITSPLVRELAADVLIAVAGAIATSRKPKEAAANLASNTANAGKGAAGLAHTATGAIAEVVTETARRILPSSAASEGEGRHVDHIAGNGGKKKRKDRPEPRREH